MSRDPAVFARAKWLYASIYPVGRFGRIHAGALALFFGLFALPTTVRWAWLRTDDVIAVTAYLYLVSGYPNPPMSAESVAKSLGMESHLALSVEEYAQAPVIRWTPKCAVVDVLESSRGIGDDYSEWLNEVLDPWGRPWIVRHTDWRHQQRNANHAILYSAGPPVAFGHGPENPIAVDYKRLEAFRLSGEITRFGVAWALAAVLAAMSLARLDVYTGGLAAAMLSGILVAVGSQALSSWGAQLQSFSGPPLIASIDGVPFMSHAVVSDWLMVHATAWWVTSMAIYPWPKEEDPSD